MIPDLIPHLITNEVASFVGGREQANGQDYCNSESYIYTIGPYWLFLFLLLSSWCIERNRALHYLCSVILTHFTE